jgi:hypothetical protein
MPDELHCRGECANTYDEDGFLIDEGGDCYHCSCCCPCLGCLYGPRDSVLLTPEQTKPMAEREVRS